jgi:ubiquinone biosynthesis protein Coq4
MQDVLEKETVTRISEAEARYLRGENEPLRSSILTSNSDYLNNPRFRDVYAQMGLKKDGHDLPGAYLIPDVNRAFAEVTDGPRLFALLQEEKARLPEFAEWLDARYTSSFTAESLQGYAPGTLGARMHDFIASSGMSIDFMFLGEAENDYDYLNKRRIQNHDIEHMVTGLDPSPVGEVALIVAHTVMASNYFSEAFASELNRFGMFLTSTGLMRMACHYGHVVPAYLDGIARGRALGEKQKRPLFMVRWEDYLDWTIADIRKEFRFEDGPEDGYWTWTFEASKG